MAISSKLLKLIANKAFIIAFVLWASILKGQTIDILKSKITLPDRPITLLEVADLLASEREIYLSYNSSYLIDDIAIKHDSTSTIEETLIPYLEAYKYTLVINENRLSIIFPKSNEELSRLSGYIYDAESGESLAGVIIHDQKTGNNSFTNEYGFFSLLTTLNSNQITISYLGYKSKELDNVTSPLLKVYLEDINKFKPIVILDNVSDEYNIDSGAKIMDTNDEAYRRKLSFQNDILDMIKAESKVQSGNEGQGGYVVNGGTPDQNLLLMDGLPVYEMSHALGLGSIFINNTIKSAEVITNGVPARYGGKLNSVLDVKIKKGSKKHTTGHVGIGLHDIWTQVDGPIIDNRWTYNIGVRKSVFNLYLPGLLEQYTDFDNSSIDYHDLLLKTNYIISSTSNLSLLYYSGRDVFRLGKSESQVEPISALFIKNINEEKWGNDIFNIRYNNTLNSKIHFSVNAGQSEFLLNSTGSFYTEFRYEDLNFQEVFNLYSSSGIRLRTLQTDWDYYAHQNVKLRFGLGHSIHSSSPGIKQNTIDYFTGIEQELSEIPTIESNRTHAYIETIFIPSPKFNVYGGWRFSRFSSDIAYVNLNPKLNVTYKPNKNHTISFSYDNAVQYDHDLINSGLGLPSDLVLPSGSSLAPKHNERISLSYEANVNEHLRAYISPYYTIYDNLVQYNNFANVFFIDISSGDVPNFNRIDDYKSYIVTGSGKGYGIQSNFRYETETIAGWLNYSYSRLFNRFDDINGGETFPDKYDRPHDLNIGLNYIPSDRWSFGLQYIYGSGNNFTLPLEEFDSVLGIKVIADSNRNNFRLPSFQKLNIFANHKRTFKHGILTFDIGVTNVLNRKNAYFIYLFTDPINNRKSLRKVSLFPILPRFQIVYAF